MATIDPMAQLFDPALMEQYRAMLEPPPEAKRAAGMDALLALGLGLLGNRSPHLGVWLPGLPTKLLLKTEREKQRHGYSIGVRVGSGSGSGSEKKDRGSVVIRFGIETVCTGSGPLDTSFDYAAR